jgi:hypothetical protein
MRLPGCCVLTGLGGVVVSVTAPCVQVRADDFQISFAVGSRTRRGHVAGRIEMRLLTAHAGNGYWEDQPGPEGRQGANLAPGQIRLSMSGRSRIRRGTAERPLARPRRLGHLPKPISPRTGPAPRCRGQSPCFAPRHLCRQLLIRRRRLHPLEPCNGTRRIERFGGFFRPCRPPAGQWEIARPISCNAAARSWASVPIHEQTMLSEVTAALIANVAPVAHLP